MRFRASIVFVAGVLGMAASFLILLIVGGMETVAGAAGFVAGSILVAGGLVSGSILAAAPARREEKPREAGDFV